MEPFKVYDGPPPLRNRAFRELRGWCMTLHHVEKAVTLQDMKCPQNQQKSKIAVGGDGESQLIWETAKPQKRVVRTCLEYVAALRLLMGNYAFCGTYMVESKVKPGTVVQMMPWGHALAYCDEVTEKVIKVDLPDAAKLSWMRARDEQTRADMTTLINEEWPACEALDKAREQQAHYWRMEDRSVAAPPPPELRAEDVRPPKHKYESEWPAGKGKGGGGKGNKGGKKPKLIQEALRTISTDSNGVRYCGAFNARGGCVRDERKCPQRAKHRCSIQLWKGKACGDVNHGATGH